MVTLLSLTAHADFVTSGIFLAKVLRDDVCGSSKVTALWQWTMRNSFVGQYVSLPFSAFAVIGWVMMCAQGVYVLAFSIPLRAHNVFTNEECEISYKVVTPCEVFIDFDTVAHTRMVIGQTVQVLADATRMASVTIAEDTSLKGAYRMRPNVETH